MNIKDKIKSYIPEAAFADDANANGGMAVVDATPVATVTIMPTLLRILSKKLHDDPDLHFDYLRSLTGMDWGEEGLGVVYHLESTVSGEQIVIKTVAVNRNCPEIPTVTDIWKAAVFNEREVYDYYGIAFTGHPDMRRLYLRDDWVGYPLRKDFDESEEINPLRMNNEIAVDTTTTLEIDEQGRTVERVKQIFEDDEYVINIGPQHPATHGVLRFRVSLEGEIIKKLDVHCGYIHRGVEKMCESLTYPQTLALTDRLDYLGAMQNRHALCRCIEGALGVELPERVQYIRTIMDELQRIDSHLLFFSTLCMDLGALTAFFYGFRDREKILDIFEQTCGGRLILNYNVIGGVQADIAPDFARKVKDFIAYMRPQLREYHNIFTGNIIAQERMKGVGVLTRDGAISYGATGGTGRASGWACDVRKRHPYAMYGKVDFREIVFDEGDCFARYMVRMDEIVESMNIIEQLIDNIPEGDYRLKMKPIIKLPEGCYYSAVESSRGEFGVFIESHGEKSPYRMKFRSTGLPLVSCIDTITRGSKIADLIAIGGTLDYIVPDIDR
jgi:NADH-quinone oxidoreductase subunit C/D